MLVRDNGPQFFAHFAQEYKFTYMQAALIFPIKEAKWAARSVKFLFEKGPLHWHMWAPQHIY